MHTCPVCGYNRLSRPAEDFLICPSCGTEFGYHDANTSVETLRLEWIASGAPWRSLVIARPADWNPILQLVRSNLVPGLIEALKPAANTAPTSSSVQMQINISGSVRYQLQEAAA